jgi:hypothetical protein
VSIRYCHLGKLSSQHRIFPEHLPEKHDVVFYTGTSPLRSSYTAVGITANNQVLRNKVIGQRCPSRKRRRSRERGGSRGIKGFLIIRDGGRKMVRTVCPPRLGIDLFLGVIVAHFVGSGCGKGGFETLTHHLKGCHRSFPRNQPLLHPCGKLITQSRRHTHEARD